MNTWIGHGRLTKDPEVSIKNDKTICRINVAVNRFGKDSGADFIPCTAFGKTAEYIGNYGVKGQGIVIEGSINTYSTGEGANKKYGWGVNIKSCELIGGNRSNDGGITGTEVGPDQAPNF
jgi:single-strand DNA-binding protein